MTNELIILTAKKRLVTEGVIKETDEIHTYGQWKRLGYQVFRGEKAVCSLNIWQYFKKNGKVDEEGEEDERRVPDGKMRMRRAYFFSTDQVFAIEG